VLELLVNEREPLTLSKIATRAEIPPASCHAILHTLKNEGYAAPRIEGRAQYWQPTLALYHLGSTLIERSDLRAIAVPHLRMLSDRLGLPAHLGVLVGENVMYLEKAEAESFIQFNTFPGKLSPFEITALGRAIVAFLPEERRASLAAAAKPRIRKILNETREAGYAIEDGEDIKTVGCVAAPVFDREGEVIASVGVTGFSDDLFSDPAMPAVGNVVSAGRQISAELGHRLAAAVR
jgi:DNA-binding IclR family transcriptional regulator